MNRNNVQKAVYYGFIPLVIYIGMVETGEPVHKLLLPFM